MDFRPIGVTVCGKALRAFKERALKSEVEVLAYLAGEVYYRRGKLERIVVREFLYPEAFEKQTVDEVRISAEELARLKEEAEPLQIVGSLHSHPYGKREPEPESGPSCTDIQGAQDQELIYGDTGIWSLAPVDYSWKSACGMLCRVRATLLAMTCPTPAFRRQSALCGWGTSRPAWR